MVSEPKGILLALVVWVGFTVLAALGYFLLRGVDAHVVIGFVLLLVLVGAILVALGFKSLFGKE
jgi:hypothetical protein